MSKKKRFLFSALAFIIPFIIYILTLAPNLTFTDCGELASVCVTMGIAHSTGYPLFIILGHLWSLLPLPYTKIYIMNLFAAFSTAMSAAIFFNICHDLFIYFIFKYNINKSKSHSQEKKSKSKNSKWLNSSILISENQVIILSIAMALFYSFARTIWDQATSIEVYSLQCLMINLIIYSALRASITENRNTRKYLITALLIGLGFSNHMTTMLLLPGLVFLYFKRPGEKWNFSKSTILIFILMLFVGLFGLSLYIYLPICSATNPEFNWGWVSRSLNKFLYHVQGKQYQVWMFKSPDKFFENAQTFFSLLPFQIAWIGILPLLLGFYKLLKHCKELFWFFILILLTCFGITFNYGIHDIDTYFVTAYTILILITAIGTLIFIKDLNRSFLFVFLLPIVSFTANYTNNDESDNYSVPEYTRIKTEHFDLYSIVISSEWDYWCSAFWYKQRVEGYRPDIVLIEKELLRRTWYLHQLQNWYPDVISKSKKEIDDYLEQLEIFESGKDVDPNVIQYKYIRLINSFIDKNFDSRPIYITQDIYGNGLDNDIAAGYRRYPQGFAFRLTTDTLGKILKFENFDLLKLYRSLKSNNGHLINGMKTNVMWYMLDGYAVYCYQTHQFETALDFLKASRNIDPTNQKVNNSINELEHTVPMKQ